MILIILATIISILGAFFLFFKKQSAKFKFLPKLFASISMFASLFFVLLSTLLYFHTDAIEYRISNKRVSQEGNNFICDFNFLIESKSDRFKIVKYGISMTPTSRVSSIYVQPNYRVDVWDIIGFQEDLGFLQGKKNADIDMYPGHQMSLAYRTTTEKRQNKISLKYMIDIIPDYSKSGVLFLFIKTPQKVQYIADIDVDCNDLSNQNGFFSKKGSNRNLKKWARSVYMLWIWIYGLFISVVIGNIVTKLVIWILRDSIDLLKNKKTNKPYVRFTVYLGILETIFYTICFVFKMNIFIIAWLGVKVAGRWSARDSITSSGDYKPGTINIFLIGNLLSLLFSLAGGAFIVHFKTVATYLPFLEFWK